MNKKMSRRPHGGVPIVKIDGQEVTTASDGQGCGLKRRPLPDGRYYVDFKETKRVEGKLRKLPRSKTFGTDPKWAIYRFVCWCEGRKRKYRKRGRKRRRPAGVIMTCSHCKGKGTV